MKKKIFLICLVSGLSLIVLSCALLLSLHIREWSGAEYCEKTVTEIEALLPDRYKGIPFSYPDVNMPVLEIGEKDFAAIIDIPAYGITLPVADEWSDKLNKSPARFYGSAYDNTLVIGGTDSKCQFGFCDEIDTGAVITVTDMTGAEFTYAVARIERSKKADTAWLLNEKYALTVFCRDTYSMEYIALRCVPDYD